MTVTAKIILIETEPKVLMLHVCSFVSTLILWCQMYALTLNSAFDCRYSGSGRKITRSLQTPEKLDLRAYMPPNSDHGSSQYRVIGCLNHMGTTLHGGHYTADMKWGSDIYNFNDEQVLRANSRILNLDETIITYTFLYFLKIFFSGYVRSWTKTTGGPQLCSFLWANPKIIILLRNLFF